MMMSLFSVFDPTSFFGMGLNWLIILFMYLFMYFSYYLLLSGYQNIKTLIYLSVNKMFNEISFPNYLGMSFICVLTFIYLSLNNLMGLFPFVFSATAHPYITLGWGIVLWVSFVIMGFLSNFKNSVAHLVPEGAPLVLSPLLVLIESVSHLIRPFTLSIRLAANMMAGHLIVGMLSGVSIFNVHGFVCSVIMQSVMLVLEFSVAVIQGFVFSILLLLYALEYY